MLTGEYESALLPVLAALRAHLPAGDVSSDVIEFKFKQLLHDNSQTDDGVFFSINRQNFVQF